MKMMKKAMSFLIAAGFLITLATPVSAESQTGSDQWQVAFDGQKMKANYTAADSLTPSAICSRAILSALRLH